MNSEQLLKYTYEKIKMRRAELGIKEMPFKNFHPKIIKYMRNKREKLKKEYDFGWFFD